MGGFVWPKKTIWRLVPKLPLEVESIYASVGISLGETFSSFSVSGFLDGGGIYDFLELGVNKTMEDSLSDLLPSYKEVLNRIPLQIFLGGKTHSESISKTNTNNPFASGGDWGGKSFTLRKVMFLEDLRNISHLSKPKSRGR
jgi:hypothetical protein